ncbi:MAG TPA: family 2A encapsulin nanocompartment cargo protein cysteine desulfurase [Burkholderiaceae bacterium]
MASFDHGSDAGALAAGLPDVATLARLAGELFSALPGAPSAGGVPVPSNPLPAGLSVPPGALGPSTPSAVPHGVLPPGANLVPASPQALANTGASAPALLPHAAVPALGLNDTALQAAPGYDGRAGGVALGVPRTLATPGAFAEPPRAASAQAPLSTNAAPHYFLADRAGDSADAHAAQSIVLPSLGAVHERGFGLPDSDRLRAMLAANQPSPGARAPSAPQFYFHDPDSAPVAASDRHPPFDVNAVRRDFPILRERVNGRPLVWFDNAATTQKPQVVIDRLKRFYETENSNIHRAAHELAARATDAYEGARETVRRFIGAGSTDEIVFVRGTTEAINLVAKSWGAQNVAAGDEIVVSHLEHHANIVPWQQLAAAKGATLRVIPVDDDGQVLLEEYRKLLNDRTRIVAVTQVSNALGTVVPVREIVATARRAGICTLVDGAQSVSHMRVDVRELDTDFFVFSGHKIFGPTGIGALYGRKALLDAMPPWQGGGNMIADVTFEKTIYHGPPARFEAGTGNIADAVGLGAALEYVERLGIENIGRYEHALLEYATHRMAPIPGLRLVGTARDKASVLSFVLDGYSTQEVGLALNEEGIAVRTGHHCAQPILRRFGLEATVRPSLAFYNTCEEVDRMVDVVRRLARRRG